MLTSKLDYDPGYRDPKYDYIQTKKTTSCSTSALHKSIQKFGFENMILINSILRLTNSQMLQYNCFIRKVRCNIKSKIT